MITGSHIKNKLAELDVISLMIVLGLTVIGLFSIYSAASYDAQPGVTRPFIKQIAALIIGIGMFSFIFLLQKRILREYAWPLYGFGILMLIVPFFTSGAGDETNRWISLGFMQLQTSEFMKFFLILVLARYFSLTKHSADSFAYIIKPLMITILPVLIVFAQPDLGTSMVYIAIFGAMIYASGARVYYIFLLMAPVITILAAFNLTAFTVWGIFLGIVIFLNHSNIFSSVAVFVGNVTAGLITPLVWNQLKPYQQTRVLTLFNAELDPQGAGYQVLQSQIAIGSGGLRGKGFLSGTQTHLRFLPEQHTDFIFSVIAEELGFVMVAAIFILFFVLFIRWFTMAYKSRDKFGSLLIVGGTAALLFHFFINIGMTVGIMPVTGKPLPFLSYGGSFLLTCYGLVGIILNGNSEQIPQVPTYR